MRAQWDGNQRSISGSSGQMMGCEALYLRFRVDALKCGGDRTSFHAG